MRKSALLIIFLVVFLDLVGFGIVIPILPYYAQHYGANAWTLGWLMTSYSLMQFFFAPIWGRISDYVGRRPILLLSILGSSLSMMVLGLAGSLQWLFIGRLIAGICGANISTAYAYVADVTTEEDRAKGMGLIGVGFGLGFIFGPAIGGVLSRFGYSIPMFFGALLALVNFLFALVKLEEPRMTPEARAANRLRRFDRESLQTVMADTRARLAVGVVFLVTLAVAQMETVFAIHMGNRYAYDAEDAGVLLAIMGLVMVTIQGGFIGKLSARFGEIFLILVGLATCGIALVIFASTNMIEIVVLSLIALAIGHGVLHPSLSSLASFGAASGLRGSTMGLFHSASSLARVLGPPMAGWLFDRMSWRSPFYAGAILLGIGFLLSFLWRFSNPELSRMRAYAARGGWRGSGSRRGAMATRVEPGSSS